MLYNLDYYVDSAREAVQNDNERDATYAKIRQAASSQFENPEELKRLAWIGERKFPSTAPADALNAAIRTFAARLPQISLQPLSDDEEEYARTEQMEELMKWEFTRMNFMGKKSPHWKIVEYAMKYCAVAIETSYLPYLYQGRNKEPRIQEILRSRNFRWAVHDPGNIHSRESDDILESVVNCDVLNAQQIIDRFGLDNPGVSEMLATLDKSDASALNQTYFSFYDYTDWDARVKWISPNGGAMYVNRDVPNGIELMRQERKVSFLPWVIVDNQEPILKGMVDAGLWDNVNILRTMQFSKTVDMVAHPEYWIQTPDGTLKGVHIDNENPNQPLVTQAGVNVNQLRPPMIDPQMAAMVQEAEQEVFRTTVAQILASVEKYAGTQNFSVVNAMLNAAVAQLSLAQMAAERAETLAMIQNFRWIDETEIPMVGFRVTTRGENSKRGKEISIKPGDFDVNYLYLTVTLKPATITDKQTEINNAINKVERLGMSKRMAWDDIGVENYELSEAQKSQETLYEAFVQSKAKEIIMKPDMEAQQQMQAQQQQQQGAAQTQFSGQQGFANRGGTTSTMPGMGREQMMGQAASGQELA
jgi:hypothetical protein